MRKLYLSDTQKALAITIILIISATLVYYVIFSIEPSNKTQHKIIELKGNPDLKINRGNLTFTYSVPECNGLIISKNGSKNLCLTYDQIYALAKAAGATEMNYSKEKNQT